MKAMVENGAKEGARWKREGGGQRKIWEPWRKRAGRTIQKVKLKKD